MPDTEISGNAIPFPAAKEGIAAGVVLYRPNPERAKVVIEHLLNQVCRVYVYDNGPEGSWTPTSERVTVLGDKTNLGMGFALNRMMAEARLAGFRWLITMDQDSILPYGAVETYAQVISSRIGVGIVCPQAIDSRRPYMIPDTDPSIVRVEHAITSASCTSIFAWEAVGGFDEELFIDLVDNDFSRRLRLSGFSILRANSIILDQQFGDVSPKTPRRQRFWLTLSRVFHSPNLAKFSYKKRVDSMRVYYTNRNIIYLNRKLGQYGRVAYNNYNCRGYLGFQIAFNLPSLLRGSSRIDILRSIIGGIRDGRALHPNPWIVPSGHDQCGSSDPKES